uniref:Uncharacterized protein LOC113797859 n=1 Tax=Dermatophagoides pteronyssinus TaxID=6956 RepID=A0A6P6YF45_DERPT|nr:uncharacterized protein LOC113797859 [Dermatophagoides pteronyssinus]
MATNDDDEIQSSNNNANEEDVDPVDAYRQSLSDLVMNSKPHIVMLTMLAEESKDTRAAEIVNCIEQRLFHVNKEIKLPTLYLIDSICKNVRDSSYLQLFEKRIVKLFCHVFEKSDEKTRLLLYKLRQTWNTFFSSEILYQLDVAVKSLDPGWPIVNKKSIVQNGSNVASASSLVSQSTTKEQTVKQVVIPVTKTQNISTAPPASKPIEISQRMDQQSQRIVFNSKIEIFNSDKSLKQSNTGTVHPTIIHLNKNDIISKRNQIENELRKELISKAAANNNNNISNNQLSTSNILKNSNKTHSKINNNNKKIEQSPTSVQKQTTKQDISKKSINSSPSKLDRKRKSDDIRMMGDNIGETMIPNDNNNKKIKTKIPKRKRPLSPPSSCQSSSGRQTKKNPLDELMAPMIPPPDDVIPLGSNHHVPVTKRSKEPRKPNNVVASKIKNIKNRRQSPPPPSSQQLQSSLQRNRHQSPSSNKSGIRSRLKSPTKSIVSDVKKMNIPPTSSSIQPTVLPAPNVFSQPEVLFNNVSTYNNEGNNQTNGFAMDRDYRREFDAFMNDARNRLNAGMISTADHEILVREAEREFFQLQQQQPQSLPLPQHNLPYDNSQIVSAPPPLAAPNQSFLEPPYGSSALFINKQFCRLFYLDPITGIVPFKTHADTPFDQLVSTDPLFLEPKQVYFSGHPTKVIIDPGTASEQSFCLNFNNPSPYLFHLSGIPQPQRIMLGLPDRELIVNDRPYKAQFGGAPVPIYFEADLQTHLFLLSDSKPFLQVSDEPRYDLWNRLVDAAKAKMPRQQLPLPQQQPPPPTTTHLPYNYGPSINIHQQTSNTMLPTTVPTSNTYHSQPIQTTQIVSELLPQSITTNVPFQQQPTSASSLSSSSAKPTLPDLDSLLLKLSAAGLISSKTASTLSGTSTTATKITTDSNKKQKTPAPQPTPKRFLPLEMSQLKQYHQFAIDQLYQGLQCTNCSLRFPNESDSGKKSRYSRHLDWHFRQNRREKIKPEFGSTAIAHRRPWYYTIDQWILYKEVNDDIEENNGGFFDSNSADSPSSAAHRANQFNMSFAPFKECIDEFDSFIEAISCDNINVMSNIQDNKDNSSALKICSVVADSDVTSNCAVCNEAFKIEWYEDEEEWRLINAVCYNPAMNNGNDEQPTVGRHFHPLCLKDHLLQQLEKQSIQNNEFVDESNQNLSLNSMLNTSTNLTSSSSSIIPGLDMPIKDEEEDTKIIDVKVESSDVEMTNVQQQLSDDGDNTGTDLAGLEISSENEQNNLEQKIEEPESFEVKVEEFEITIETITPPLETTNIESSETKPSNISDERDNNDEKLTTATTDGDNNQPLSESKPKRPLIVLKMKNSSTASTSITSIDEQSTNKLSSNIGNVSDATNNDNEHSRDNTNDDKIESSTSEEDINNKDIQMNTETNNDGDGNDQCGDRDETGKKNNNDDDNNRNEPLSDNKVQNNANETTTASTTVSGQDDQPSIVDDPNSQVDYGTVVDNCSVRDSDDLNDVAESMNEQQSSPSLMEKDPQSLDSNDNKVSNERQLIGMDAKDLESNINPDGNAIDLQKQEKEQQEQSNYYSRGKEVSSLCSIM